MLCSGQKCALRCTEYSKLNQYTTGGVVAPGGVILELLPVNDELVIEARVNPNEITHVK
jgi:hypothetical protein